MFHKNEKIVKFVTAIGYRKNMLKEFLTYRYVRVKRQMKRSFLIASSKIFAERKQNPRSAP